MIYEFPIVYTFRGVISINAENAIKAREIAIKDCGAHLSHFHTSNDQAVIDWDINMSPEKSAGIIIGGRHE